MNLKLIIRVLGFLIFGEGIALLLSLLVSLIYGDSDLPAFIITSAIALITGGILLLLTKKAVKDTGKRDDFIIVSFSWIIFSLFGCLPYIISGSIPNFTDAFFETISGFTTTGASVLTDIEALPYGILFWRSFTQWLGGIGIIVLSLAILPVFGIGDTHLFMTESTWITPDKISPKIRQTAKTLWLIYIAFTLFETVLLWTGGMTFFDAINHSFTTMGTGGFSTKQDSIAYWDSSFIQYVIIVFMFFGGTNFILFYILLKGKFKAILKYEEFKFYSFFILGFTLLVFAGLLTTTAFGIEKSFRDSLFQVISIITTTGFATADYLSWTPILTILIFILFFFGGCTGSTSGGIKIMRIVLLLKNSYYELRRMIHPNAIIPVKFNKQPVDTKIITNILAFFTFYFLFFAFSTVVFTFFESDIATSMGAVASSLGNVGPGLGKVGPVENFAHIAPAGKWFLSFLMLLGRLEFFTILILFSPSFWKD